MDCCFKDGIRYFCINLTLIIVQEAIVLKGICKCFEKVQQKEVNIL